VRTVVKKNGKLLSSSQVKYDNESIRPTSTVITNPYDGSLKTTQRFDAYDSEGNIRQYTSNIDEVSGQGVSAVVIWGYHKTLPIAKITGAKLADIGNLADDIMAKSDLDIDDATEKTLLQALDTFRSHPALKNFQITTYTHNPLMGATSVTPPNGIRESYTYDQKYRLKSVIDVNGNIVSDYKYNTKPQP
jgi:YD repeat-containing protein